MRTQNLLCILSNGITNSEKKKRKKERRNGQWIESRCSLLMGKWNDAKKFNNKKTPLTFSLIKVCLSLKTQKGPFERKKKSKGEIIMHWICSINKVGFTNIRTDYNLHKWHFPWNIASFFSFLYSWYKMVANTLKELTKVIKSK